MTPCKTRIILGILFALFAVNVSFAVGPVNVSQYKPAWVTGQRWKVDVERMTEAKGVLQSEVDAFQPERCSLLYQFEVEGPRDAGGESCFSIRIHCIAIDGKPAHESVFYRVFMRQSDQTLKEVQRLNKETKAIEARRTFASGPIDATDWVGFLPLAFPAFHEAQTGPVIPDQPNAAKKVKVTNTDRCSQAGTTTQILVDGKKVNALKMTLEKDCDGSTQCTIQNWVKGMPWWSEATHDRGGSPWCSAKLLKN